MYFKNIISTILAILILYFIFITVNNKFCVESFANEGVWKGSIRPDVLNKTLIRSCIVPEANGIPIKKEHMKYIHESLKKAKLYKIIDMFVREKIINPNTTTTPWTYTYSSKNLKYIYFQGMTPLTCEMLKTWLWHIIAFLELKGKQDSESNGLNTFSKENQNLKKIISDLTKQISDKNKFYAELQKKCNQSSSMNSSVVQKIELKHKKEIDEYKKQIDNAKQEVSKLQKEIMTNKELNIESANKIKMLQKQNKKTMNTIDTKQASLLNALQRAAYKKVNK